MTDLEFLRDKLPEYLKNLEEHTSPAWGIMTAQHMLEHLGGVFRLSSSYREVPLQASPEQLPKLRQIALSGNFPKNMRNPAVPAKLPELRFGSFEEARQKLLSSVAKALEFLESDPEKLPRHPIGGDFSAADWIQFHAGHTRHHFRQFGLLQEA